MTESNIKETALNFVVKVNSDSTEGRGRMIDSSIHKTAQEAYAACKYKGVMGVGDGEIWERTLVLYTDGLWEISERRIYGYLPGKSENYNDGQWIDEYDELDPRMKDPDYVKYLELKRKYGK